MLLPRSRSSYNPQKGYKPGKEHAEYQSKITTPMCYILYLYEVKPLCYYHGNSIEVLLHINEST